MTEKRLYSDEAIGLMVEEQTIKQLQKGDKMTNDNIHMNCENYSPKKDYCLKFFEDNVSEKYKICKEYSEFNDKELSRKWSN